MIQLNHILTAARPSRPALARRPEIGHQHEGANGAWLWLRLDHRLLVKNFTLIRIGMSQSEVEELLGGPPRNYGSIITGGGMISEEGYRSPPGSVERIWCDDSNRFEIFFDSQGRVVGHHKRGIYSQEPVFSNFLNLFRDSRETKSGP
jgi:hypothetical protein